MADREYEDTEGSMDPGALYTKEYCIGEQDVEPTALGHKG